MIAKLAYSFISVVLATVGGILYHRTGIQFLRERWAIYIIWIASLLSTKTRMVAWKISIDMGM